MVAHDNLRRTNVYLWCRMLNFSLFFTLVIWNTRLTVKKENSCVYKEIMFPLRFSSVLFPLYEPKTLRIFIMKNPWLKSEKIERIRKSTPAEHRLFYYNYIRNNVSMYLHLTDKLKNIAISLKCVRKGSYFLGTIHNIPDSFWTRQWKNISRQAFFWR